MKEYIFLLRGGKPATSKSEAENKGEMHLDVFDEEIIPAVYSKSRGISYNELKSYLPA